MTTDLTNRINDGERFMITENSQLSQCFALPPHSVAWKQHQLHQASITTRPAHDDSETDVYFSVRIFASFRASSGVSIMQ